MSLHHCLALLTGAQCHNGLRISVKSLLGFGLYLGVQLQLHKQGSFECSCLGLGFKIEGLGFRVRLEIHG